MARQAASGSGPSPVDGLTAGRRSLARGAWDEARGHFASVLEAGESAEAREGLGWAQWWLGLIEESFAARERAFVLYSEAGERRRAARVAIHLAVDGADLREPAITNGWLERAERLLEGLPAGVEHAWLALWRGHVRLYFEGDSAAARELAHTVGGLARDLGVRDLELLARALEGLALVRDGQVSDGMRRLDESTAAAIAGEISDLDSVSAACCFMVYACEHVRDYDRARQWQRRVEDFAGRWRVQEVFAGCRIQHAQLLAWQGRWKDSEALLVDVMRSNERRRPPVVREAAACLGELRRRQGRAEDAEALFAQSEGLSASGLGLAALAYERGDMPSALEHLERAGRRVRSDNLAVRTAILELTLRARLRLGEPEAALAALEALESIAERAGTPPLVAAAHLGRGRVAIAAMRWNDAVRALEDSVDLLVPSGAPYETALARLELAEALRGAGRQERARREAERAHAGLKELGVVVERRTVGASRRHGPTRREMEVLRLVADGLSDRAIANRLNLSEHTVHRHVANLLAKLECGNRAAAVSRASRLGYL